MNFIAQKPKKVIFGREGRLGKAKADVTLEEFEKILLGENKVKDYNFKIRYEDRVVWINNILLYSTREKKIALLKAIRQDLQIPFETTKSKKRKPVATLRHKFLRKKKLGINPTKRALAESVEDIGVIYEKIRSKEVSENGWVLASTKDDPVPLWIPPQCVNLSGNDKESFIESIEKDLDPSAPIKVSESKKKCLTRVKSSVGSVEERLKGGRNNQVRRTLLAPRPPFSARCVVSCVSDSPIDVVYLPEQITTALWSEKDEKKYAILVRYPICNRGQTLFFQVRPWEFNTAGIPLAVFRIYNMDCDGDAVSIMAVHGPIEIAENLLLQSPRYAPHNGKEFILKPTHDIIAGFFFLNDGRSFEEEMWKKYCEIVLCEDRGRSEFSKWYEKTEKEIIAFLRKRTEYFRISDIYEGGSLNLLINSKASRLTEDHLSQVTKRIGGLGPTKTPLATNKIEHSFLEGGSIENEIFSMAQESREKLVSGKLDVAIHGKALPNLLFCTRTCVVDYEFKVRSENNFLIDTCGCNLVVLPEESFPKGTLEKVIHKIKQIPLYFLFFLIFSLPKGRIKSSFAGN